MLNFLNTIILSSIVFASSESDFVKYVVDTSVAPETVIVEAMNSHSVAFIGDSHRAAEPKEILIKSFEALEKNQGVDFVVLEISSAHQKSINDYLASSPEDISILINNPATLRAHWGISVDYLNIYRSIWRINQARPLERKLKIIAADHANWPPPQNTPIKDIANMMSVRDEHMLKTIEENILIPNPRAKTLIFMGTFHGAKTGSFDVIYDTNAVSHVQPVGERISKKYPGILFSAMMDGMPDLEEYENGVKSYGFGRYFDFLFSAQLSSPLAVLTDAHFDFVEAPFYHYEDLYWNGKIHLREQYDAYVYLGKARLITFL